MKNSVRFAYQMKNIFAFFGSLKQKHSEAELTVVNAVANINFSIAALHCLQALHILIKKNFNYAYLVSPQLKTFVQHLAAENDRNETNVDASAGEI